jgi:3alpha(or 20beta)-hydroxysteroid dehydrogenase
MTTSAVPGRLAGRYALVTGALGGIGSAVVRRFIAEGAAVMATDTAGPGAVTGRVEHYHRLDVRDPAAWSEAVAVTVAAFGALDVLVNNAGVWRPGPITGLDVADVREMFEVNQLGCLLGMAAVADPMAAVGGGAIVNVSSGAGTGGYPGQVAYGATKWAVRGMTKTAALELGVLGIRVNSVHPGSIDTPMTAAVRRPGGDPFAFLPVPRRGEPEEVAAAVAHLASAESAYTTGAELVIDGGLGAGPHLAAPRT